MSLSLAGLAELREQSDVLQACPLCRAELPPGLDGLYDLGARTYKRIVGRVKRGELAWTALPKARRREMEDIEMITQKLLRLADPDVLPLRSEQPQTSLEDGGAKRVRR